MSFPPPALQVIASKVASLLMQRNETLSIVETATGGLMSAAILSIPGTSKCFLGGVTAYSLESRKAFLGWTDENVKTYNGPNPELVLGLARHLRKTLVTTWCLAESGATGPTRPDVYRPDIEGPGYCAYGLVREDGGEWGKEVRVPQPKTRDENMVALAEEGLKFLLEHLENL
ncbi:hypothetical protein EXIGLDRAFT_727679 [Exidia glandulosa HHB12029]|uniref:CinA C-terminal domain-containing protein n=1 Tax=Exidia glandulosa HHB12029 TaxID=1314781 RepID=A0A165D9E7_EXIGL|nr:hypothetical protein EXIGLDRAFT_727679 [Exidia glandulosa HHB12029]